MLMVGLPIGSHHVKLNLKAGRNPRIVTFVLGYHENPKEQNNLIRRLIRRLSITTNSTSRSLKNI